MVMVRIRVKNRIGRSQSHEEAGVKAEVCTEAGVTWGSKSRMELDWDQS